MIDAELEVVKIPKRGAGSPTVGTHTQGVSTPPPSPPPPPREPTPQKLSLVASTTRL